ncbi:MAG: hypothetical protein FWD78_16385 [Treponema sp.]|nr:hypothetical protein [Treponema sp.]
MADFYASADWVILCEGETPAVRKAAEDLGGCIKTLDNKKNPPAIMNAAEAALPQDDPVIILSNEAGPQQNREFSWRAGDKRIEIYGQSGGGLCRGVYDFLSSLGISWPDINGAAVLPQINDEKKFSLKYETNSLDYGTEKNSIFSGRRLAIPENNSDIKNPRKRTALMRWAIRNNFDAVVLPIRSPEGSAEEAQAHGLIAETGGWIITSLVPRKNFLLHRDCFRMEGGKRQKKIHFCPTNPQTIAILKSEAKKIFGAVKTPIINVWPDRGEEQTWCSCPACRAFSMAEQCRMAVNAAADALAEVNPSAAMAFYEAYGDNTGGDNSAGETIGGQSTGIGLRKNIILINPKNITVF